MQALDVVSTATDEDVLGGGPGPARPSGRRSWGRARAPHVVALLLLLIGVALLGDRQDSWTPDDGAYALQVHTLRETGDWEWPYAHTDIDPDLAHVPFTHGVVTTEGEAYPYAKLPAWIVVLRASTMVFGEVVGLFVPSLLGAVAAALVAWALASRFDRAAAPWAFWAVGLGPLLVQSTAMWAHTTAAALGGLCALWVVDAARGRKVPLLAAAATLAVLPVIRNEGMFVVAVTVAVLGGIALSQPGPRARRLRHAAGQVATLGLAGASGVIATRMGEAAVAPGAPVRGVPAPSGASYVATRVTGATRSLLDGAGESTAGSLLALAALLAVLVGGVLVRRGVPPLVTGLVVGGGLALLVVRSLVVSPHDLAGFFVAAPLIGFAVASRPPGPVGRAGRALAAWAGLYGAVVLATQYAEGGSRDWGGRYFLPLAVPVAVSAVVIMRRTAAAAPTAAARRVVTGLALALVVAPTLLGVSATLQVREVFGEMTRSSVEPGSPVVVRMPDFLARVSWRAIPEGDWLATEPDEARDLLVALREKDAGVVTLSGPGAGDVVVPGYARDVRSETVVVFTPIP